MWEASSIEGMIRLQIEAATITPAAKPVSARSKGRGMAPFRKNTHPAPAVVPRKGRKISRMISMVISSTSCCILYNQ